MSFNNRQGGGGGNNYETLLERDKIISEDRLKVRIENIQPIKYTPSQLNSHNI